MHLQSPPLHADQVQPPLGDVDLDQVAIFDQRNGSAIERLGRDVTDRRAFGRSGVAAVGHHRGGMRQSRIGGHDRGGKIHLRHAVRARAFVADHHHVAWLDLAAQQRLHRAVLRVEHARLADVNVHLARH